MAAAVLGMDAEREDGRYGQEPDSERVTPMTEVLQTMCRRIAIVMRLT
jgi:hypothetical protein